MRTPAALLWVAAVLGVGGCGDHPPGGAAPEAGPASNDAPDAASADAWTGCPAEVDPPAPPSGLPCASGTCAGHGPDLGDAPCPPGWRADRVPEARGTLCWPPAVAVCEHPDAIGGCAEPCGGDAPLGALHVAPGEGPGDGTAARPHTDLADALGRARAGDVVFLHPGRYAGPVEVPAGVTVRGACATTVEIAGPADGKAVTLHAGSILAAVTVRDTDDGVARPAGEAVPARVEGVRIIDARRGVVLAGPLDLRSVAVLGDGAVGIYGIGGVLEAEDVVVRGPDDGLVMAGGRATVTDALFVGLARAGIAAAEGAQMELRRVAVSSVGSGAPMADSVGLQASNLGTRVVLERVALLSVRGTGLHAASEAVVEGRDVLVADIGDGRHDTRGVSASVGARLVVDGLAVIGVRGGGISSAGAGASATVRRAVVTDIGHYNPPGVVFLGHGLTAVHGGTLDAADVRVARFDGGAVSANAGGSLRVRDAVLGPAAVDALYGGGLVGEGADLVEAERVAIEGVSAAGGWFEDTARVHLRDVRVVHVGPVRSSGHFGVGLGIVRVPDAQLERVHVERARLFGVEVFLSTTRASDLVVADTQEGSDPDSGTPDADAQGMGLTVAGGVFEGDRIAVRDSHVAGIWLAWLADGPTTFAGRQVHVSGSRPGACQIVNCLDLGGHGFLIERDVRARLEGVVVEDNSGVGIHRACDETLALRDARVSDSAVGIGSLPACDPLDGVERTCLADNLAPYGAGTAITPPAAPGGGPVPQ